MSTRLLDSILAADNASPLPSSAPPASEAVGPLGLPRSAVGRLVSLKTESSGVATSPPPSPGVSILKTSSGSFGSFETSSGSALHRQLSRQSSSPSRSSSPGAFSKKVSVRFNHIHAKDTTGPDTPDGAAAMPYDPDNFDDAMARVSPHEDKVRRIQRTFRRHIYGPTRGETVMEAIRDSPVVANAVWRRGAVDSRIAHMFLRRLLGFVHPPMRTHEMRRYFRALYLGVLQSGQMNAHDELWVQFASPCAVCKDVYVNPIVFVHDYDTPDPHWMTCENHRHVRPGGAKGRGKGLNRGGAGGGQGSGQTSKTCHVL